MKFKNMKLKKQTAGTALKKSDKGFSMTEGLRPSPMNLRKRTILYIIIALSVLAFIAIGGTLLRGQAMTTDFTCKNLAPCWEHWFGTDWMGRDMLVRTITGLSMSVLIGVLAASVSAVMGIILGTAAAVMGPKTDGIVTWLIDLVMGVPHMIQLILISFALGKGAAGIIVGVALTHWTSMARVIRGEVLQLKQSPFILTAEKLGQSKLRLAARHMVPHILPQFLVGLILLFPHAILHEASITFLGFGLSPEQPAIGIILSESMRYLSAGLWWLALFPGCALVGVVMLFDLTGSSLRRLMDPGSAQE